MDNTDIFDTHKGRNLELLCDPVFRVVGAWMWFFIGAFLTLLMILGYLGAGFSEMASVMNEQRHLTLYIELVSAGLFPLVISFLCGDEFIEYGFTRTGFERSMICSVVYAGVMILSGYLMTGQIMKDDRVALSLNFPLNIWYGLGGILVWGPLEVFFFNWLVVNTERALNEQERRISLGLIITVILFTLTHVFTTNWFNAIYTGIIFLVIGIIFKLSKNIFGPMMAWTIINGQVWYMAQLLF